MLKEQYPELYTTITTPDTEVLEVIRSYMGKFDCYADLRDAVREHYYVSEYSSRGHISNQLEMYWHSCNHDHKIACGK
jgi:hypothetical protein